MRKAALRFVTDLAARDKTVCFIGSDLGFGTMDDFPDPDRLFREGVSEQHVIGMAAGLALEGQSVYINTIASFLTRRCYEQIYLDLCLNRARVRLLASGGGLVYAPLGPTHLAPDDLALLRPLPHLTILAPCDADEMRRLLPLAAALDGPVYIRLAKGGDAVVSPAADPAVPYAVGRAVPLRPDGDVLFITTGIAAQIALAAADLLAGDGISAQVLHCHTVKPLDTRAIVERADKSRLVVTVEEHVRTGGLGSAVAELFVDQGLKIPLRRAALPDAFFCEHGSQNGILTKYGLDSAGVAATARRV
jgi:transketolase